MFGRNSKTLEFPKVRSFPETAWERRVNAGWKFLQDRSPVADPRNIDYGVDVVDRDNCPLAQATRMHYGAAVSLLSIDVSSAIAMGFLPRPGFPGDAEKLNQAWNSKVRVMRRVKME